MKKRIVALLCGLLLGGLCFAQLPMSVEKELTYLENDLQQKAYSKVKDQNNNLCALIKVSLSRSLPNPLILEVGGLGVTKTEQRPDGEIWFFVPYQVKNLEFKCKDYTPIPKIPVNLRAGGVYTLSIRVDASTTTVTNVKATSGYLKIRLNPADAFISLGKTRDYELGYMSVKEGGLFAETMDYGTWYYKVESELYKTYEGVVNFDSSTPVQTVNLEPDYAYLDITTDPSGADVYVDNKYLGKSPVNSDQKYKNGQYSIRLIKEDYYSLSSQFVLNGQGDKQHFAYSLKPRFGIVECICDDPKSEIWIDEQYKGTGRWKGSIGSNSSHILEARRAGHMAQSQSFSLQDGEEIKVKVGSPVPLYAILKIETQPMECEVYVDGQKMGESPLQIEVLACEHTIKLVKDDFMPIEDKVLLSHNQQLLYQHTFTEKKSTPLPASNCFIVSQSGTYSFKPVKGNSSQSVGQVSSVAVLWETFGTATKPNVGDLIQNLRYKNGLIIFSTADTFREGNTLIAAKDASGTILWSWHIWMTDQPQEQQYKNNAGIMMDRNLGATSATPGDVGALGLLYQWGRKDPFLGSSSISKNVEAKATISFPEPEASTSSTGTIAYATSHPTTFIYNAGGNNDWQAANDNSRWQSSKTIYDPCPAGWRVPDGGSNGVWCKAFGTSSFWGTSSNLDSTNKGMDFSKTDKTLANLGPIWYPTSGYRYCSYNFGLLYNVGNYGLYWSVALDGERAQELFFGDKGHVNPSGSHERADGLAVRCMKENNNTSNSSSTVSALVSIDCEPIGCEIIIDGQKIAENSIQIRLSAGKHSIRIQKEGYDPIEDILEIKYDYPISINYSLITHFTSSTGEYVEIEWD